ncbi:MAG: cohesin domain-containing protein [Candidatus Eisenbacteria bacterium]
MSLAVVPVLTLMALVSFSAGQAEAAPHVFFEPASVILQPGESEELSFRVAPCEDSISGYQLYVSFDPSVVELVSATQGSLYAYSGHPTWFIPEEEEPGLWHFFDTVMGTGTYVTPPGELLHLEFEALDYGDTEVHIESILLADIDRENLPVGSYEHAHIFVVPLTGVEEGGGTARLGPAYPNPFTAGTAVPFYAPGSAGDAVAEIYDVRGRLVRRIPLPGGVLEGELAWDGKDERGQVVPSSVYFLRMTTRTSTGHCRLVKTE